MKKKKNSLLLLSLLSIPLSLLSVYFSANPSLSASNRSATTSSGNDGAQDGELLSINRSRRKKNSNHKLHFQVKLSVPEPVIVVGLPKSGTTTIWNFFNCSNVVAQHYCSKGDVSTHPPCHNNLPTMATCILRNMSRGKGKTRTRTLLEGCGDYQVYAQIDGERPVKHNRNTNKTGSLSETGRLNEDFKMRHFLPQHFYLDELHHHAPNATYILPLRKASDWADSVYNWFRMRYYVYSEYKSFNRSSIGFDYNPDDKLGTLQWLERIFQEHTQMVRNFVRQHPSHLLVEVNMTSSSDEGAAGRQMSQIFGLPEECWGHHNKREEHDALTTTNARRRRRRHRAVSAQQ